MAAGLVGLGKTMVKVENLGKAFVNSELGAKDLGKSGDFAKELRFGENLVYKSAFSW